MPANEVPPVQGLEFRPEVYLEAAKERAGLLQFLYDADDYVVALYIAGVAVESMFRAFRARIDPRFDSRHDLYRLAADSRFASGVPASLADQYAADLGTLAVRWSNSHRYRSEAAARRYLKRARLDRGIKGDFLKENARLSVSAAIRLVSLGANIWMLKP
jgi:hypothetical protein